MKIGLFGAGNMGGALLEAIIKTGKHTVSVFDPSESARARFAGRDNVTFTLSAGDASKDRDLLIMAVKPGIVPGLIRAIAPEILDTRTVLLSVAAGVRTSVYAEVLGEKFPIVRAMPNLPALAGEGYTGLFYKNAERIPDAVKAAVAGIFNEVGETSEFTSEEYIDRLIPVTSSSPAFICMLIEAMADGAVRLGFTRTEAYRMCEQAVLGTAAYLKETGMHPAELKDRVCSPAGTTIEAVAALEEKGFRAAILDAMEKCLSKLAK